MTKPDDPLAGVEAKEWCVKVNKPVQVSGRFHWKYRKTFPSPNADPEYCNPENDHIRLLPEPAVRKVMVEMLDTEADDWEGAEPKAAKIIHELADRLERGGGDG